MKNKLPVIGKRYKQFSSCGNWILKDMRTERTPGGKREAILVSSDGLCVIPFNLKDDFWDYFEELPDQEPTTEESSTVGKIISDPDYVELLIAAKFVGDFFKLRNIKEWGFMDLQNRRDNSLAGSNKQETPVSSMVEHASKSIWKPISELPDYSCRVFVRMIDDSVMSAEYISQYFDTNNQIDCKVFKLDNEYDFIYRIELIKKHSIKEYCTLTDFINHQESLEKRIERLEQLTKEIK